MSKKLTALLTGILLLCCCLLQPLTFAADTQTGTVHVDDSLNVRSGPGTGYKIVGSLSNNDQVTILATKKISNTETWYQIQKDKLSGWASADYITINVPPPEYKPDASFEELLKAFPEDYKDALRKIHAEYPKWKFVAEPLSMTWATALKQENKVGTNTIYTSNDAWKSMEKGAYNWSNGTYVNVDSGYVTAAPQVVAYYMDPRNFLDTTYIFQFEDLTFSDKQTVEGIQGILPAALDKHAADLLKAAKAAKVNAYFLATRMTQEGSHINKLGLGTYPGYEGYYNFFNIGAYPHSGNTAVLNGAIYAKNHGWNTPYKALLGGAEFLGKGYINLGQDTLYYQKFNMTNTTSGLYTHQYMTNVQAPSSEANVRRRSITKAELDSELTFMIPVYKNMPKTVAEQPEGNGNKTNNNNFLDSITVTVSATEQPETDKTTATETTTGSTTATKATTGSTTTGQAKAAVATATLALTPSFNRYTGAYSLQVGSEVSAIRVAAKKNNTEATLRGAGNIPLKHGENVITLRVTATSGAVRTYTLTVTREGVDPGTPHITVNNILPGKIVTGVEPGTAVADLMATVQAYNGTVALVGANGKAKAEGVIATGDSLQLHTGDKLYATYPIIIYGDVNGDGKINSQDLRRVQRHILGVAVVAGHPLTAADANRDGKVNSQDLRRTQRHILGLVKTLQQEVNS